MVADEGRRARCLLCLSPALALLAAIAPHVALADAAPRPSMPGASLSAGEAQTQVRMLSEDVLLTTRDLEVAEGERARLTSDLLRGVVEASFVLRNEGGKAESFDVWFPLQRGRTAIARAEGFEVEVDGRPAPITLRGRAWPYDTPDDATPDTPWREIEGPIPDLDLDEAWATWPMDFPPGVERIATVRYELEPEGYPPYGTFRYVVDTGAGWRGTIGEGTLRVRLPYDVNETNMVLNEDSVWDTAPEPPGAFTVEGRDVVWRFQDLEPDEDDNLQLTVLAPTIYEELVRAREAAAAAPDSAKAQLRLGEALLASVFVKSGSVVPFGSSQTLHEEAGTVLAQADALDPNDPDILLAQIEHLYVTAPRSIVGMIPGAAIPYIRRAFELAPEDEDVARWQGWLEDQERDQLIATNVAGTATVKALTPPRPTRTRRPRGTAPAPATTGEPPTSSADEANSEGNGTGSEGTVETASDDAPRGGAPLVALLLLALGIAGVVSLLRVRRT